MSDIFYNSLIENIKKTSKNGFVGNIPDELWANFLKDRSTLTNTTLPKVHVVEEKCEDDFSDVKVAFISDTPSLNKDKQFVPFSSVAEEMLEKMFLAMGLTPNEVYFSSILKSVSTNELDEKQLENAIANFYYEIKRVNPAVIIVMGSAAISMLFDCSNSNNNFRGQWLKWHEFNIMPTFHPNYLLRETHAKRDTWNDLKEVMKYLKNC